MWLCLSSKCGYFRVSCNLPAAQLLQVSGHHGQRLLVVLEHRLQHSGEVTQPSLQLKHAYLTQCHVPPHYAYMAVLLHNPDVQQADLQGLRDGASSVTSFYLLDFVYFRQLSCPSNFF